MVAGATLWLIATLSGCSLVAPAVDAEAPSDVALCTMGHRWDLDTADLAAQVLTQLQDDHPDVTAVEANGTVTLDWDDDSTVELASDLSIVVTAGTAEEPVVITEHQKGTGGGKAHINAEIAIPRAWRNDIEVETSAQKAGVELETVPFELPATVLDDSVGLELACDAGTLTIHPRGSAITQRWTTG